MMTDDKVTYAAFWAWFVGGLWGLIWFSFFFTVDLLVFVFGVMAVREIAASDEFFAFAIGFFDQRRAAFWAHFPSLFLLFSDVIAFRIAGTSNEEDPGSALSFDEGLAAYRTMFTFFFRLAFGHRRFSFGPLFMEWGVEIG